MLFKKVSVLGDIPVIEIGDAQVQQDVEKEGEIEERVILPVSFRPYSILHGTVDTQEPKGFDHQVQKKQERQVGDKFSLHYGGEGANLTPWDEFTSFGARNNADAVNKISDKL